MFNYLYVCVRKCLKTFVSNFFWVCFCSTGLWLEGHSVLTLFARIWHYRRLTFSWNMDCTVLSLIAMSDWNLLNNEYWLIFDWHVTERNKTVMKKVLHSLCTSNKSPAFRPTLFLRSCDNAFSLSHRYCDSPGPKTSRWWKILVPSCVYCLNCTKFGPLILRKINKIVATKCQILRLKCTKFDFVWGPAWGAYSTPPDSLAGFKGAYF